MFIRHNNYLSIIRLKIDNWSLLLSVHRKTDNWWSLCGAGEKWFEKRVHFARRLGTSLLGPVAAHSSGCSMVQRVYLGAGHIFSASLMHKRLTKIEFARVSLQRIPQRQAKERKGESRHWWRGSLGDASAPGIGQSLGCPAERTNLISLLKHI